MESNSTEQRRTGSNGVEQVLQTFRQMLERYMKNEKWLQGAEQCRTGIQKLGIECY
jgi:hypothetical protein